MLLSMHSSTMKLRIELVWLYDIVVCQNSTIQIWLKSVWWQRYLDCEDLDNEIRKSKSNSL